MRTSFTQAAATAAMFGFTTLSSHAAPPTIGVQEIEAVFAGITSKGISAFYQGAPSKNFDHLTRIPGVGLNADPPPSIPPWALPKVRRFEFDPAYYESLHRLKEACPALDITGMTPFDTASWFLENLKPTDLSAYQRTFLEALYFTIGSQPDSSIKTAALAKLNPFIPDSQSYVDFLQAKRDELGEILKHDKLLTGMKEKWAGLSHENKQAILSYISLKTLKTLLPHNDIVLPKVYYLSDIPLVDKIDGVYDPGFHEIYANSQREEIANDYDYAVETIVHESFHAFQHMLINWALEDKLGNHIQLKRQAKLQHLDSIVGGTGIGSHEDYTGYRTSFRERGAWAFQVAASGYRSPSITTDMFMDLAAKPPVPITTPPVYRIDRDEGRLPLSCLPASKYFTSFKAY